MIIGNAAQLGGVPVDEVGMLMLDGPAQTCSGSGEGTDGSQVGDGRSELSRSASSVGEGDDSDGTGVEGMNEEDEHEMGNDELGIGIPSFHCVGQRDGSHPS